MADKKRLDGKVALISGGAMGMGRAAAVLFAAEGAKVAILDVDSQAAAETVGMAEAAGGQAVAIEGDVSIESDVERAVRQTATRFRRLDVLYANAGVLWKERDKSVIETTEENWDRVQAVNLKGAFFLTKHGIPELKKAGGGSIILAGSISGVVGFELAQDSYTCAKGALIALCKSLAVQFGPDKIRCNIIHPGIVDTPLQEPYLREPGKRDAIAAEIPLRRLGTARDVANAALFLASDESSFVTGAELTVDGGFLAR